MARTGKSEALIGIGKLDKLAGEYERTGKTLRKLAKALRRVTESVGGVGGHAEATDAPKAHQTRKTGTLKRKGMSPAARKHLSEAMKARWAAKRAEKAKRQAAGKTGADKRAHGGKNGVVPPGEAA